MNTDLKISFIGAGNMARSLIGGLINDHYPVENIVASDHDAQQCTQLSANMGVKTTIDNIEAAYGADIIVLAVKPQMIAGLCRQLEPHLTQSKPLIISIAAGIRCQALQNWLGASHAIVRTMPNTPSLVGAGAAALFATDVVSDAQRQQAESILRAVGVALWVDDESQMDAITALSGCGPAYFFLVMEIMQNIGEKMGLTAATARLLTLQTGYGATKMALESEMDCAELRRRVTSPGGVTERAINKLLDKKIDKLFTEALTTAQERSIEMANLLEKS
ncbi:MAG: pyrroline-5-carboxylate reductase [Gammaproteobacteria bacterium]|nr:pyrroline-5-carboxylate reductase [Gammaproteobacteria bacterium]